MTKIGIVVAMAEECRSLTRQRVREGGCLTLEDGSVIGFSGAGPKAAGRMAAQLAERGATRLVSWGCAAALSPGMNPGDLILPSAIVGTDGDLWRTDDGWRERLSAKLMERMPVHRGQLAESVAIVAKVEEKQAIHAATGALALDMESAASARVAQSLALPFLAIRSIVDPVHVAIPPSIVGAFDENGMLHVPKMLRRALARPVDFLGVIRLGRHFGAAMKTLRASALLAREINFGAP